MQKVYRLIIIGVMMSVLGSLGLSAQIKGYNIVVSVTPDHQDWNYKVGEKANFTVNVRKSGTLLTNVKVDYEAGPATRSLLMWMERITKDSAPQASLPKRFSLMHRNLRILMLFGRKRWMRLARQT